VSGPGWTVLLLGGASGAGKTVVAAALGRRLGLPWVQLDDFRLTLERATTPAEQPHLHYLTAPGRAAEVAALTPEDYCAALIAMNTTLARATEIVVAHHVGVGAPLVLEGDGVVPEVAAGRVFAGAPTGAAVRAVFLDEPDEAALHANMLRRGRGFEALPAATQRQQARAAWLYGAWLAREARRLALPVVPARPWDSVLERVLAVLPPPLGGAA
jgi:2-phosphoglycerate kinase